MLEAAADQLERYQTLKYNPYAICSASVGSKKDNPVATKGRSKLAATVRSGGCSANMDFNTVPTRFLYAYAFMRRRTKKGSTFFPSLPTPAKFFKDPAHYRVTLLKDIHHYLAAEGKKNKIK
jgi:hypothetical protein